MNEVIVDAGTMLAMFLPGPCQEQADRLLDKMNRGIIRLAAPDLMVVEFGEILSGLLTENRLNMGEAQRIFSCFIDCPLETIPAVDLMHAAFELMTVNSLPFRTAMYLAAAARYRSCLITMDDSICRLAVAAAMSDLCQHLQRMVD
ncbi:type II toxin-antitoxin system VapC family toxin [bacterium]|nr:type II toxin-antitoxin system VapC family toxin [candidate division CSSED10-310 bacterium]